MAEHQIRGQITKIVFLLETQTLLPTKKDIV